jgi:membrane-associated phospholipid phosphatase
MVDSGALRGAGPVQPYREAILRESQTTASRTIRRVRGRIGIVAAALSVATLSGTACSDPSSSLAQIDAPIALAPSVASAQRTTDDDGSNRPNVSVHWNEVARALVAARNTNTPMASRVYALVSVAQFDAATALDHGHGHERDQTHGPRGAVLDAAIARASADVLTGLFPDAASAAVIAAALEQDGNPADAHGGHGGPAAGDAIGANVARAVLARAATDRSADANCPATPPLPASEFWHDDAVPPNPQGLLPCFGNVRTWLGLDRQQFRAGPPPAFGSPAFLAGVAEVRQVSDTRTAAQLAIVNKWLDAANTFSISGRWNLIASDLVEQHHLDAAAAARLFAVLNIAMMDTHIACWDRKYVYWEIRPWQVDPLITTPGGKPHHPSNPSGHACAGGAGSGVLAGFFPNARDSLFAMGDEQGFSTLLAGVHFRFDVEDGSRIGRTIAMQALHVRDLGKLIGVNKS